MKQMKWIDKNFTFPLIGIDEVGRGAVAGPVYACAFLLPETANLPEGVKDSKKLSPSKRASIAALLKNQFCYNIGWANVIEIEELGIIKATKLAMQRALLGIKPKYNYVIIDGNINFIQEIFSNSSNIIKGDSISYAIAAASIIAKVARDSVMANLSKSFPQYKWQQNAGYGTAQHLNDIKEHGACMLHRASFIKKYIILE